MTSSELTQVILALIASLPAILAVVLTAFVQMRHAQAAARTLATQAAQVAATATEERAANVAATRDVAHKVEYVAAQSQVVAEKIDAVAGQTAAVTETVGAVVAKTEEVHQMVNSRLSEALAEIARLQIVVEGLREAIRQTGGAVGPLEPSHLGERPEKA
jgi:GDP-D-mannose dehydratase